MGKNNELETSLDNGKLKTLSNSKNILIAYQRVSTLPCFTSLKDDFKSTLNIIQCL